MLRSDNCVLVIVDVQEKLASAMHDAETLVKRLEILTRGCEVLDVPVLITEQLPSKLGRTMHEVAGAVDVFKPFDKSSFSCCGCEKFQGALDDVGRENIILAGIETHVCIYQTSMDLLRQRKRVHLVTDAVTSRSPDDRATALQRLDKEGVLMTSTEMLLFELMRDASHPEFKTILNLVK